MDVFNFTLKKPTPQKLHIFLLKKHLNTKHAHLVAGNRYYKILKENIILFKAHSLTKPEVKSDGAKSDQPDGQRFTCISNKF